MGAGVGCCEGWRVVGAVGFGEEPGGREGEAPEGGVSLVTVGEEVKGVGLPVSALGSEDGGR